MMIMDDELLSDILAAEGEIRMQIDAMEEQLTLQQESLRQELDQMLENASRTLQAEREEAIKQAEQAALLEAETLLAEARAYALQLNNLDTPELDRVVLRQLARLLPEGAD
jgi:vacuolar-type H+-ATPase subunit H